MDENTFHTKTTFQTFPNVCLYKMLNIEAKKKTVYVSKKTVKEPPLSSSINFPVFTSTNVRISPIILSEFHYQLFCQTCVKLIKAITSVSPKLNLNQEHPSKILVFLVKPLYNWFHDNFSNRNARVTKLWLHGHIYSTIWVTWQKFVGVIPFILRRHK